MDHEARILARRAPDDPEAALRLLLHRARTEGTNVYVEPLRDRESWNKSSRKVQDLAIEEVERRLDGFTLRDIRLWYYYAYQDTTGSSSREFELTNRLAAFEHRASRIEMHLIPGLPGEPEDESPGPDGQLQSHTGPRGHAAPFLIARRPVRALRRQWTTGVVADGGPKVALAPSSFREILTWLSSRGLRLPTVAERLSLHGTAAIGHAWSWRKDEQRELWNEFGLAEIFGGGREWCKEGIAVSDGREVPLSEGRDILVRAACSIPDLG